MKILCCAGRVVVMTILIILTGLPAFCQYQFEKEIVSTVVKGGPYRHVTNFFVPPGQPTNPLPADASVPVTLSPNLCATVSDPDGGNLLVRFYGRKKPSGTSGKFTFIFLPDTQYYTEEPQGAHDGGNSAMFNAQTAWIAANRASKKIAYVGHLGDCVQNGDNPPGSNNEIEWQRAVSAMAVLESEAQTGLPQGIPFGICVGNHDQTPIGTATGTTNYYNQFFGISHFTGRAYYGGHNGSNNDNHFQLVTASGVDFLIISFEFDASAGFSATGGALDWAEGLVQTYNTRNVIVMTHYGINENQTFGTQGQAIYNRLRNYPNFRLFMCGHIHTTDGEARRTDVFNGNTVHTILSDYQGTAGGGNGQLRIYEFDPQLNTMSGKTFSPHTNTSQTDADSQFELPVNLGAYTIIGEVNATSGSSTCVNWPGLTELTAYEWFAEVSDGVDKTAGPLWTFTTPPNPPLPVDLVSFTATSLTKKVRLNWRTTSEFNNSHFNIQRSSNGTAFIRIGEVAGGGTTSIQRDYLFFDEWPIKGKSWYRLQQVDMDNNSMYSKIAAINFAGKPKIDITPNPVTGSNMHIHFAETPEGPLRLHIHDLQGKEVFNATYYNISRDIIVKAGLPAGVYIVNVQASALNESIKIVVGK